MCLVVIYYHEQFFDLTLTSCARASGGEVGILGSGSDFTPFLSVIGTSCLDTGSDQGETDPIYHYHSNYDSYYWMANFGDPGFLLHKAMGQ